MTLSPASSIGFAVLGGAPSDVRQWISVDLSGFPGAGRRGYVIAVEPVSRSWEAIELGNQVREIILTELRRLNHVSPDEALGRALAAANGVVYQRNRESSLRGNDELPLIGVTAVLFDGESATFAFLPPGQFMLIQDALVYTVPDLRSWFPDYQELGAPSQAEPLGYTSWTAPLMAQTELRPGDTIVLCMSNTGRAYAESLLESGLTVDDLTWHHRRDPERILDSFRDVVIASELASAGVAVISFPPLPNNAQIQTLADVRSRARESMRHGKAMLKQFRPARSTPPRQEIVAVEPPAPDSPALEIVNVGDVAAAQTPAGPPGRRVPTVERGITRLQHVFEGSPNSKAAWRRRSDVQNHGVAARHGVSLHREQTHYMGDTSWRHTMPRLPIIGSAWIWPVLVMVILGLVLGGTWVQRNVLTDTENQGAVLTAIDTLIVEAADAPTDAEAAALLHEAEIAIENARKQGVPAESLDPRSRTVEARLDDVTDVIRVSDVRRIGALPPEFDDEMVQGVRSDAGVFFVSGSLFQYRPNPEGGSPELITILSEGDKVGNVTVGQLWGVAIDALGLYVTDGETAFMLPNEAQEWKAVPLGKINEQTWKPGSLAAFGGSIYLLESDGRQIYRFSIDGATGTAEPRDWLLTGARDDIQFATDFSINVDVFVLLDEGTIQLMHLGDRKEIIKPPYMDEAGEDDTAIAIVGPESTGYFYVAVSATDHSDGRIVAFDSKGKHAVQLKLPIGLATGDESVRLPFDGVREVIVDESTGTIYIINADAIWTARYSLPDLPVEPTQATPVS